MNEIGFYINVEDSSGNVVGEGPIISAEGWTYTARMDRAGSFSFSMPANDTKAELITKKAVVRAWCFVGGLWTEVGAGIVDNIQKVVNNDGSVTLNVSGDDLLRELTYRSVLDLKVYLDNAPITHSEAITAVSAFAPPGWTFNPASDQENDSIYGRFNGENVLTAIIKIAEKSQTHFVRGTGREVTFRSDFFSTSLRAINAYGDLDNTDLDHSQTTCSISSLSQHTETFDLITRIYPRGSGNGDVQLTLKACTLTAPEGFVLDKDNNYIESTEAVALYGRIEQQVDFKEIGPIENTTADVQAAANMLFLAALEELIQRSTEIEQTTYEIELQECSHLIRPLESFQVDYREPEEGLIVSEFLNVLESTISVDNGEVKTTSLIVSNVDRWPQTDAGIVADAVQQASLYQALPQLNANSYTTSYVKNIDADNDATIRFRFGNEVVQLQQVLLEFKLLPFESTVKTVGGLSGPAGAIPTSGPSTDETNLAGVTETGTGGATATDLGGPTTTGTATGDTGSAAPVTGSETPTIGSSTPDVGGTALTSAGSSPNTGGATGVDTGSATTTVGGSSPNTGGATGVDTGSTTSTIGSTTSTIGSGTSTIGGSTPTIGGTGLTSNANIDAFATELNNVGVETGGEALETGSPQGGDVVSAGRHIHFQGVGPYSSGTTHALWFIADGDNSEIVADGASGNAVTTTRGDHTHAVGSHTHAIDEHAHSIETHTHAISSHTHTIDSHTHTTATHTHTISSHTHTVSSHTHTTGAHTHTVESHTHTTATHTHTTGSHTHTVDSHTHTTVSHTHTIASHNHTIAAHTHTIAAHTHTTTSHSHTVTTHSHTISQHTHSLSQHTHTLSDHVHDLADSLTTVYGVHREEEDGTYTIDELEYNINGGAWAALNTATLQDDSWYALDVTDSIMDPDTFRPTQPSNTIGIRSSGETAIAQINGTSGQLFVVYDDPVDPANEGKLLIVSGTSNYDGTYRIVGYTTYIYILEEGFDGPFEYLTGTTKIFKTVTIDSLLSVRNVIQAITYI
jgi:hypothetical protein